MLVADLTTEQIDNFYNVLLARGGVNGRPLKPGTVQRVHVVLRAALAHAMRWGWIWDNAPERAHRIVVVSREPEPPTTEELVILLDHLRNHDTLFHAFVMLAAMTGARRAQLLALRWRDVNLTRGQIAFCNLWVEGPTGPVLTATKSKRRHTVELDQPSIELLAERLASLGDRGTFDHFVFATPDGTVWKPNWTTKAFQRHLTTNRTPSLSTP